MAWVMSSRSSRSAEDQNRQQGPDNYGGYVKCRHEQQQQKGGSDGVCRWKDSAGAEQIDNAGSDQHRDTDEQRQHIFVLLQELEGLNPTADPINSPAFSRRSALLYTPLVDEKTSDKYAATEGGAACWSWPRPGSLAVFRFPSNLWTARGAATEKGAVHVDVMFDLRHLSSSVP